MLRGFLFSMTKINVQLPLFEDKPVKEFRRDGRKR